MGGPCPLPEGLCSALVCVVPMSRDDWGGQEVHPLFPQRSSCAGGPTNTLTQTCAEAGNGAGCVLPLCTCNESSCLAAASWSRAQDLVGGPSRVGALVKRRSGMARWCDTAESPGLSPGETKEVLSHCLAVQNPAADDRRLAVRRQRSRTFGMKQGTQPKPSLKERLHDCGCQLLVVDLLASTLLPTQTVPPEYIPVLPEYIPVGHFHCPPLHSAPGESRLT